MFQMLLGNILQIEGNIVSVCPGANLGPVREIGWPFAGLVPSTGSGNNAYVYHARVGDV